MVHAVGTDVLLDVRVFVIVDAEAHVAGGSWQVRDQAGLADRRFSLKLLQILVFQFFLAMK
jgi:hypothetical protein